MNKIKYLFILLLLTVNNTFAINDLKKIKAPAYFLIEHNSNMILAQKNSKIKLEPEILSLILTNYFLQHFIENNNLKIFNVNKIKKNFLFIKENQGYENYPFLFLDNTKNYISLKNNKNNILPNHQTSEAIRSFLLGNEEKFKLLIQDIFKILKYKTPNFNKLTGLNYVNNQNFPADIKKINHFLIKNIGLEYNLYKNKNIKQNKNNKILYNPINSIIRNESQLTAIVLGVPSVEKRKEYSQILLKWGYKNFITRKVIRDHQILKINRLWLGENRKTYLGTYQDIYITVPRYQINTVKIVIDPFYKYLIAPIYKNEILGKFYILINNKIKSEKYNLIVLNTTNRGRILDCIFNAVSLFTEFAFTFLINKF